MSEDKKTIKSLFSLLESTVPHHLIVLDGLENEDCFQDLDENKNTNEEINSLLKINEENREIETKIKELNDNSLRIPCAFIHPREFHENSVKIP